MAQDEMIEKLARAICGVNEPDPDEEMLPGTPCWVALIPEATAAYSIIRERMGAKDEAIAAFLLCIRDLPKDSCARRAFSHVEALSRAALTTEGEKSDAA